MSASISYEEYLYAGLDELGKWLRSGQTTATELAEFAQQALTERATPLNGVVTLATARAQAEARRADEVFKSGRESGPLAGIPYGAKDLLATGGGLPTTWGAAPLRQQTFEEDATVIRLLENSGATLVAKLAMVELAGGGGYNQPNASFTGPAKNPRNPNFWTGGSSSGSGAAVGCGAVPFALGSETWGSILSPASYCGIVGMRPTYGLVSRQGAMALSWSMDKIGPMAHSAADCAKVLESIGRPDPTDPVSSGRQFQYRPQQYTGKRWRFGVLENEISAAQPEVGQALEAVISKLGELGTVTKVQLEDLPSADVARIIIGSEFASAFEDLVDSGQIQELTAPEDRLTPYTYNTILAKDYLRALRLRSRIAASLSRLFSEVDMLIAPATAQVAPPIEGSLTSTPSRSLPNTISASSNLAGLPAISLPIAHTEQHLPIGLQLVADVFQDEALLVAASQLEGVIKFDRKNV